MPTFAAARRSHVQDDEEDASNHPCVEPSIRINSQAATHRTSGPEQFADFGVAISETPRKPVLWECPVPSTDRYIVIAIRLRRVTSFSV